MIKKILRFLIFLFIPITNFAFLNLPIRLHRCNIITKNSYVLENFDYDLELPSSSNSYLDNIGNRTNNSNNTNHFSEIGNFKKIKKNISRRNKIINSIESSIPNNDKLKNVVSKINNSSNYLDKLSYDSIKKNIIEDLNKKYNRTITSIIIPIFQSNELMPLLIPDNEESHNVLKRKKTKLIKTSVNGNFVLEDITKFNFTNIGGYHEIKEELVQIIDFLLDPEKYSMYGIRTPRGILLHGPPGNGKTLFAKCLAGETNTSFIVCAGSEFADKYVGVAAGKIRELFDFAKDNKPCIIFIDEFDALAKSRVGSEEVASTEKDQTLNQLLVALDGFSGNEGVMVVGATNRVDIIDNAILRPGRFDRVIKINNPDDETRKEIIKIHINKKPINSTIDNLAFLTAGLSGAQIEGLLNEATLYGIRKNILPVTNDILELQRDKLLLGCINKKQNLSNYVSYRISIHEIGHVLLSLDSINYEKPFKVSIDNSHTESLGFTMFEASDCDAGIYTREYLEDKLKVLLAGRCAEEVIFGSSISSGAYDDLNKALEVAKDMIVNYGMGNKLIYSSFSEEYKKQVDDEINNLINSAYKYTKKYLESNKSLLLYLAAILNEKKVLKYDEIILLKNKI